ncbi:MAG: tRNA (adenosine(37)-N6)-threonylcarbamoyltransferase complex ATPase subunit type 1 TsaE [Alphaproteobacteria bacterium]|nr:MAG: tRNA (adenosine(37)-N6)-threonylcarbamoyltransferase complex ATPase subunit type 1 TsaE [Alphaproteobacteria bacterium]
MLQDEQATARLATTLAGMVRRGDVLLLSGPLGAGKTAFARALIRARLADPGLVVASPSFTLVQTYCEPQGSEIWHADLYRLNGEEDVEDLGLEEAIDEGALMLVEWPERAAALFEGIDRLEIRLAPVACDDNRRLVHLAGIGGDWPARLNALACHEMTGISDPAPHHKKGRTEP